jgi:hypothetical protein
MARIESAGHRHDKRATEYPGRDARHVGTEHRHIAAAGDVPHLDSGGDERFLERKGTANREAHQIVPPDVADIAGFLYQLAVPPYAVARQVGSDVQILAECGKSRVARLGDGEQGARTRVRLCEADKIVRQRARQDNEIRLHQAGRQAGGGPGDRTGADTQPLNGTCACVDHPIIGHLRGAVADASGHTVT